MNVKNLSKLVRSNLDTIIPLLVLLPFYAVLYKIYIPRVNAFGCFDDCFNYLGGYFIANGKHIYSDFFFNHQLIPAIISYFIQTFTNPVNIFDLVLRHRQFVMIFSLFFNALLIFRFRLPAFLFVVIFELSKFYVFGDRFLAESIIVYPLVYLTGFTLLKLSSSKLFPSDYYLVSIFSWFIIFSREPYAPLALFLFTTILWGGRFDKIKKISLAIFTTFSIITLIYIIDLREYIFNIFTFNLGAISSLDSNVKMFGSKPLQIFFYPLYIFFFGGWNIFKQLLVGINIVFLIYIALLIKDRNFKLFLFVFLVLGFANFRLVLPGSLFYESFHMMIWYALFSFIASYLIFSYSKYNLLNIFSLLVITLLLISFVTSRFYFANEKVDQHAEFLGNFGETLQIGEVVRILSNKEDALFLDRSDDLIYWQAKRLSQYKYTWYTSQMNHFPKYTDARIEMFRNNPPDFYKEFGTCPKKVEIPDASLPDFAKSEYVRLYKEDKPSCLFVHKKKIEQITDAQWQKAAEWHYAKN